MSDDIVRVLRIVEYIGPRSWVDATLHNSMINGVTQVGPGRVIRTTTVGTYPDILPPEIKKDIIHG